MLFFRKYLYKEVNFYLFNQKIIFKDNFGIKMLFLDNYCFLNYINNCFFVLKFYTKNFYLKFIKYFLFIYSIINKIFFLRLRLKGLGYRMLRLNKYLIRFFFAKNHFYYFHLPFSVYFKIRRRNFFLMSFNKLILNNLYHHLMLLKKLDLYEKTNSFVLKNKILFLKKRN